MKTSNKNNVSNLIYASIVLYILVMCLPVLQAKSRVYNIIVFASFACFIMGVLLNKKISIYTIATIVLITLFDYLIFKTQWSDYTTLINKMFLLYEFWFPVLFSLELFPNKSVYNHDNLKILFRIFLIAYSITCITTIIGNMNYDMPSRWLATMDIKGTLAYKYRRENIGGFGFCYLSLFVAPLLIYLYKQTKKKIIVIPLVLSYICAFFSQYSILILFLAIITILIIFEKMNIRNKVIFIIGIFIFFLFVATNLNTIFVWLISITQNHEVIHRRIQEIYYATKTNSISISSDIHIRQELYGKSWRLFLNNPFIGGWFNSNVGGHSEILDLMGSMGLFGILFLLIILWTVKKGIKSYYFNLDDGNKRIGKLMLGAMVMLGSLNSILSSREIGMVFFIVLLFIDNMKYYLSK